MIGRLRRRRIRTQLDTLTDAVAALHADVEAWTADQNERLDALLANSADQGGSHGVTGQTGYIPPVELDAAAVRSGFADVTGRLR